MFKKRYITILLSTVMLIGTLTFPQVTAKAADANGWQQRGTTWNYFINGNKATNWIDYNSKWYYLNSNGEMQTGWIVYNSKSYYLSDNGDMLVSTITPDGYVVGIDGAWNGQVKVTTKEISSESKADEIIAKVIKAGMSDFEKELALHDYLVSHTKYDWKNYSNNTITSSDYSSYGALVNGIAVCQGYAEAMNLLLNKVGIESQVVNGTANGVNGWGGHAWNIVKIDGGYYNLDATWDDADDEVVGHDYFNVTDAKILSNHRWSTSYPTCSTSKYTYDFYMYCMKNKIPLDSAPKKISGTISLPDGIIAPKGGGKMRLSAYTYTKKNYVHTNEYSESIYVTIPEGCNFATYSFIVPLSNDGYSISYNIGSTVGYYSKEGTTADYDKKTVVDVSDVSEVTQVDIKFLKMYPIKGVVSLLSGESAPKGGLAIRIFAYIGKLNVYQTNVTIAEGTNSIDYSLNVPQNKDGYIVEYRLLGNQSIYKAEGYYSNTGTVTDYNKKTLVDMSNMTKVDFTLVKGS